MKILELNSWTSFRDLCFTTKSLCVQMEELEDRYNLYGPDQNGLVWHVCIRKADEAAEFEASYKSKCNGRISAEQLDSDGAPMSRIKVAPSGWNFQLRMCEITTSTVGSLVNKNAAGADIGDMTLKLYDADGVLITDPANQGTAVKEVLDFEAPYDIYLAGGNVKALTQPSQDLVLNVIGVPDIPAISGGSKAFIQNINLKYIQPNAGLNADGRAAKWFQYSATYHTNKFRFQFVHGAGYQLSIGILLELYKQ